MKMQKITKLTILLVAMIAYTAEIWIFTLEWGNPTILIISIIVEIILFFVYYYITNDIESSKWSLRKSAHTNN